MMKKYTLLMLIEGSQQLYRFDVIATDEESAIKRARERTGDKFVSVQSISTKLNLIHK